MPPLRVVERCGVFEHYTVSLGPGYQKLDGAKFVFSSANNDIRIALEATAATRNAYRGVATELRQVKALDKAVESSEFELGERNQADVTDARRDLFSALTERTRAKYDCGGVVTRLYLAAGVLAPQDLTRIAARLLDPNVPAQNQIPESE